MKTARFLTALAILCSVGAESGAMISHQDLLKCEEELTLKPTFKQTLKRAFANGVDNSEEIIGYTAISSQDLVSLLRAGAFSSSKVEMTLNGDHPLVQEFTTDHPEFKSRALPDITAQSIEALAAWKQTVTKIIEKRAESIGVKSHIEKIVFWPFLVQTLVKSRRTGEIFSVEHSTLLSATDEMDVRIDSRDIKKEKTNFAREVSLRKLCFIANMLNVLCGNLDKPDSANSKRLLELFAKLPTKAGAKIAIKDSSLKKIIWRRDRAPVLRTLTLKDVAGIEPNSSADFQFLTNALK
jgi:hypothetical protein